MPTRIHQLNKFLLTDHQSQPENYSRRLAFTANSQVDSLFPGGSRGRAGGAPGIATADSYQFCRLAGTPQDRPQD